MTHAWMRKINVKKLNIMTTIKKVTKEVHVDIRSTGNFMNNYLEKKVDNMTKKLVHRFPVLASVSLHFNASSNHPDSSKSITARCAIPGPDVVVSDTGTRWKIILKNIEKKLLNQLEKKKSLLKPTGNN